MAPFAKDTIRNSVSHFRGALHNPDKVGRNSPSKGAKNACQNQKGAKKACQIIPEEHFAPGLQRTCGLLRSSQGAGAALKQYGSVAGWLYRSIHFHSGVGRIVWRQVSSFVLAWGWNFDLRQTIARTPRV